MNSNATPAGRNLSGILGIILFGLLAVTGLSAQEQPPGTIEDLANPLMAKLAAAHAALKPAADEAILYYYRPDGLYQEWGFWLWSLPGGDGGANWGTTSKLGVQDGVGYFRFKKDGSSGLQLVGATGTGWIVRRLDGWTKDGSDDRMIDLRVSNEWVVFAGDKKTWPYGAYRPTIDGARLIDLRHIQLDLSGRQALSLTPADNGFAVTSADGTQSWQVADAVNASSGDDRTKNYTKRVVLALDRDVQVGTQLKVSNPAYQAAVAVNARALTVSEAEKTMPPADYQLGAVYDAANKSVEFRLWSPFARGVSVRIFKASEGKTADWTLPLAKNAATGVWTARFDQADPDGFFYEYAIGSGNDAKTALDPYALSMDTFRGTGAGRAAVINPAKALPPGGWQDGADKKLAKPTDAIIYEVSVRDFTIAPAAGTKARGGSYLAFIEKLPYLKSLGVTHLQLMPVLNFYYNDETRTAYEASGTATDNNYNWGYDPHSYFSPEGWFASNPADPYARMVELKTLIKAIHQAGMGVLLDVVYNHTASTSVLDDLVGGYYYRYNADGSLKSNSGCGNDVASERPMARRLIADSLYYLAKEYKVDGFRFDLMGLIDAKAILAARARVASLPDKADILFEGEGWKMYNGPASVTVMDQNYVKETADIAVFNDEFRDVLKGGGLDDRAKGFITDKPVNPKLIFNNLLGNPQLNYVAKVPGNNLQYVEAHDNLTMHDNISLNLGLRDSDPVQVAQLAARLRLGNFFVLTTQGIPFIHSGQESGRTKPKLASTSEFLGDFIHNSYDAGDNINQFEWHPVPAYQGLRDWTAGLIAIRKSSETFRMNDPAAVAKSATYLEASDGLGLGWSLQGKDARYWMFVNASATETRSFDAGQNLAGAKVLVDRDRADPAGLDKPQGFAVKGKTITVEPLTAIMIRK